MANGKGFHFTKGEPELPAGKDRQLDKAVEMLLQEIGSAPSVKPLRYATESGE